MSKECTNCTDVGKHGKTAYCLRRNPFKNVVQLLFLSSLLLWKYLFSFTNQYKNVQAYNKADINVSLQRK